MYKVIIYTLVFLIVNSLITSRGGKLYDNQGRQIIFRGPNIVVKVPPYSPITTKFHFESSFSQQDMIQLKSWGFNGIRLGVMWAGVQVSAGNYSQQYLQKMKDIVNLAGKYGIYSLVEFHQDVFSQKFCGDGVPAWMITKKQSSTFPMPINSIPFKYNSSGLPDYQNCLKHNWGLYYFSYDVSYAFNDLYTNRKGLLDKFQNYWIQVVKTFVGNQYVLGYQLINQPFAGSLYKNPSVIVPSMAQRIFLQNFYDRLSTTIRKIDPDHPICFQPVTWDNTIKVGFSHPPGGRRYQNQSILCYHYYMSINTSSIQQRVNDAKRLGIASILSQFSYHTVEIIEVLNKNQQSWLFWDYKTFGKTWGSRSDLQRKEAQNTSADDKEYGIFYQNGSYVKRIINQISQTYIQRLSGQLISSSYDYNTKDYSASFYTGNGKTILFANRKDCYPNGISFNIVPKNSLKIYQYEPNYFEITSLIGKNQRVLISISKL